MISGQQTLGELDQGLGSVRLDIDRIDRELSYVSEKLQTNQQSQSESLKQLVTIRLDDIARDALLVDLNEVDKQALALLQTREQAFSQLESEIDAATGSLLYINDQRRTAVEYVNQCAQAVIDCEHNIQTQLEVDYGFQAQLTHAREVDEIAKEAESKADLAQQDRLKKGLPYEGDKLFMYLWQRHYGTPDYEASPLTRYLDSWVNQLSNYDTHRVNYWTLLEIPKRLRGHADSERARAEATLSSLTEMEQARASKAGLPTLQDAQLVAQEKVDALDDEIIEQEDMLNKLLAQRANYAEAKDQYMVKSLEKLHMAFASKNMRQLDRAMRETRNSEDDSLARDLAELREQHQDLSHDLREHRQLHESKLDRLQQLEQVRRRFKQRRFDDLRSGFGNEEMIGVMLSQFLNGLVNSGELWRTIERHQRHRDVGAWPDFGSGGLGLPTRRRQSPWHLPQGRGGFGGHIPRGGGFRLPRSGGFSSRSGGGGFRTGGGF